MRAFIEAAGRLVDVLPQEMRIRVLAYFRFSCSQNCCRISRFVGWVEAAAS